jgi:prophage tail gpP-like protein
MIADRMTLITSAGSCYDWESYEFEQDLFTPAHAFSFTVGAPQKGWFTKIPLGSEVQVQLNGQQVLTGIVDRITGSVSRWGSMLVVQGRDKTAALLVDGAAPILTLEGATLKSLVQRVAGEVGVTKFNWLPGAGDSIPLEPMETIKTNPGESAWDVLSRYAGRMGLAMWTSADGALNVGRPSYEGPATLAFEHYSTAPQMMRNNCEISSMSSMAERYSKVIVYGSRQGNDLIFGLDSSWNIVGEATDAEVPYKKVLRVVDSDSKSVSRSKRRAQAEVALRKLEGTRIEVVAPGHSQNGAIFSANKQAVVHSDLLGVDGVYWISKCKYQRDRREGTRTYMVLTLPGIWGVYGRG